MRLKKFAMEADTDEVIYAAIGVLESKNGIVLDYGDGVTLEVPTGILKDKEEEFRIPLSKAREIYNRIERGSL